MRTDIIRIATAPVVRRRVFDCEGELVVGAGVVVGGGAEGGVVVAVAFGAGGAGEGLLGG